MLPKSVVTRQVFEDFGHDDALRYEVTALSCLAISCSVGTSISNQLVGIDAKRGTNVSLACNVVLFFLPIRRQQHRLPFSTRSFANVSSPSSIY